MATFTININKEVTPIVGCNNQVVPNQPLGIYETIFELGTNTGITGINYDAFAAPDRFQIEYNGVIVADSKYVGYSISGNPPTYSPLINTFNNLPIYTYNGTGYVNSGNTTSVTVVQGDIANGTTEPTAGSGSLTFNKTNASPTTMKVIIISPLSGTGWSLSSICPTVSQ